ncbi:hypothetical protein SEA_ZOOMAN_313 [Microbacterium phage Zooman]|nr:hypothetical protein SEA_ZOOMAN_313 [Microbacterium phage Zooman]
MKVSKKAIRATRKIVPTVRTLDDFELFLNIEWGTIAPFGSVAWYEYQVYNREGIRRQREDRKKRDS